MQGIFPTVKVILNFFFRFVNVYGPLTEIFNYNPCTEYFDPNCPGVSTLVRIVSVFNANQE